LSSASRASGKMTEPNELTHNSSFISHNTILIPGQSNQPSQLQLLPKAQLLFPSAKLLVLADRPEKERERLGLSLDLEPVGAAAAAPLPLSLSIGSHSLVPTSLLTSRRNPVG